MITGDNPLTACHVANTLKMNEKKLVVLTKDDQQTVDDPNENNTTGKNVNFCCSTLRENWHY